MTKQIKNGQASASTTYLSHVLDDCGIAPRPGQEAELLALRQPPASRHRRWRSTTPRADPTFLTATGRATYIARSDKGRHVDDRTAQGQWVPDIDAGGTGTPAQAVRTATDTGIRTPFNIPSP